MGKIIYDEKTIPKVIGKNIRKLRMAAGLTQSELSKIIGYVNESGTGLSKIEKGGGSMYFNKYLKICNYFGVTMAQLMNPNLKVTRNIKIDIAVEG